MALSKAQKEFVRAIASAMRGRGSKRQAAPRSGGRRGGSRGGGFRP